MAVVQSNVAVSQTGVDVPKLVPSDLAGRVRIARGVYTPAQADAAGTVIQLVRLPRGSRILSTSRLIFEAGQSASMTVKVGDEKNDARYFAAASPGASLAVKNLEADALNGYVFEQEMFVIATTGGAALTANKKIAFEIFYVID